ncbi:hypothetical protein GCM10010521_44330 [Streptomyces rameus]|uniref:Uncharacterized protein n=1 Tax=Streptomyces rameus TaxID=68261 RepID=A0ABP6NLE4_9ACTN
MLRVPAPGRTVRVLAEGPCSRDRHAPVVTAGAGGVARVGVPEVAVVSAASLTQALRRALSEAAADRAV